MKTKNLMPCQLIDPGKGAFDVVEPQVTHGKGKGRTHHGYSWRKSGEGIHNTSLTKNGSQSNPKVPKKQAKRLALRQAQHDETVTGMTASEREAYCRPGSLNRKKTRSIKGVK